MGRSGGLLRDIEGGVEITVWVVPGSRHPGVTGVHNGALRVRTSAPPEGGRANREAAEIVATAVGGRRGSVVAGGGARRKLIAVEGVGATTAIRRLRTAGIPL